MSRTLFRLMMLALPLGGCGLAQTVADGTASAAQAIFYKQVKTLHLDFTARTALNTDAGDMNALSVPTLVRVYQLRDASAVAQADQTVLIGLAGPLTGPSARIGKDLENGARLAIDQANAKHPKINGEAVTFKLVSEDDQSDPRTAVTVAQRLVDEGVVGVVGHWNTGTSIPAARVYHDAGIAQVAPVATGHAYTQQGFDTSFRIMGHDDDGGQVAGDYALNTLKAKRIAVIDDRTAFGQGLADQFVKAIEAGGAKVVGREYVDDKTIDFSAVLTNIRSQNPDLIFFGGMDAVGGPMLRQMKQLGLAVRFMGGDGLCSDSLARLAGDEFVIVMGDLACLGDAQEPAAKLIEVVAAPYLVNGLQLNLSTSIGIGIFHNTL